MTTKITVDAHAGWPVSVKSIDPATGTPNFGPNAVVPPYKLMDFYVHSGSDLLIHEVQPDAKPAAPTFGQKAVGLSFNPSGDPIVNRIKALYAEIIDVAHAERGIASSGDAKRHWSIAITDAESAQMRAVKAATWKD